MAKPRPPELNVVSELFLASDEAVLSFVSLFL